MPCTWASWRTRRDRGSPAPWMSSASWSRARRWPRVIVGDAGDLCAAFYGRHGVGRYAVALHDFLDGDITGLLAEILS